MSQNKDAKLKFNTDSLETYKQHRKELAPVQNALFYRLSTSFKPMMFLH